MKLPESFWVGWAEAHRELIRVFELIDISSKAYWDATKVKRPPC